MENNKKIPLVVICGPTASGKTALSLSLARYLDAEIVSADSMQIYRGMDIGTAKVTEEETEGIPHHMLDVVSPLDSYSVADYKCDAKAAIDGILKRGRIPILVGGTGFYIQAVLYDIDFDGEEGEDRELRMRLSGIAEKDGDEALYALLKEVDPVSAGLIHPHNRKRIIRALEYYEHTGEPISKHNEAQMQRESAYHSVFFVLTDRRSRLYERINRRAENMVRDGLIEECEALLAQGCAPGMTSMQALGYRETAELLTACGGNPDEEEKQALAEKIALNTRHYAKRQLTWFKREENAVWLSWEDYDADGIVNHMVDHLEREEICR